MKSIDNLFFDTQFNNQILELGADDYRAGKAECDNPFHIYAFPEENKKWLEGYRREKKRYEPDGKGLEFDVYDTVEWTASNRGRVYNLQGKIAAIIPPKQSFIKVAVWVYDLYSRYNCCTRYPKGKVRDHESYAVLIYTEEKTRKNKLYWPRVSTLRKVINK